jgi:hypothetical protein
MKVTWHYCRVSTGHVIHLWLHSRYPSPSLSVTGPDYKFQWQCICKMYGRRRPNSGRFTCTLITGKKIWDFALLCISSGKQVCYNWYYVCVVYILKMKGRAVVSVTIIVSYLTHTVTPSHSLSPSHSHCHTLTPLTGELPKLPSRPSLPLVKWSHDNWW